MRIDGNRLLISRSWGCSRCSSAAGSTPPPPLPLMHSNGWDRTPTSANAFAASAAPARFRHRRVSTFLQPAPGDGRTFAEDIQIDGTHFKEGERLYISWAMANRDPSVFPEPNKIILDRKGNRHFGFGLGIHRCIGSNLGRTVFKAMLTAVLERMPDYRRPRGHGHYETIGVIQGMRHLPATVPIPGSPRAPVLPPRWKSFKRSAMSRDSRGLSPNARHRHRPIEHG